MRMVMGMGDDDDDDGDVEDNENSDDISYCCYLCYRLNCHWKSIIVVIHIICYENDWYSDCCNHEILRIYENTLRWNLCRRFNLKSFGFDLCPDIFDNISWALIIWPSITQVMAVINFVSTTFNTIFFLVLYTIPFLFVPPS